MGIIKLIKEMKKAEEFEKEVREKVALLDDPDEQAFYMGRVRAIAGLTEKQLYYTWTNPKAPMVVNPKFVSACEKMGIK